MCYWCETRKACLMCGKLLQGEKPTSSCTGPSDCSAILTMIRNFPSHVGNYDADLPEKECGENRYEEQCAFRQGWAMAVDAINDGISQMQNAALTGGVAVPSNGVVGNSESKGD
jgi:hypothetical protein